MGNECCAQNSNEEEIKHEAVPQNKPQTKDKRPKKCLVEGVIIDEPESENHKNVDSEAKNNQPRQGVNENLCTLANFLEGIKNKTCSTNTKTIEKDLDAINESQANRSQVSLMLTQRDIDQIKDEDLSVSLNDIYTSLGGDHMSAIFQEGRNSLKKKALNEKILRLMESQGSFKEYQEEYFGKSNPFVKYEDKEQSYFGQVKKEGETAGEQVSDTQLQTECQSSRPVIKEGFGMLFGSDGSYYEGYFHNNQKHGNGDFYLPAGILYSGKWEKDKLSGDGMKLTLDEAVYRGNWLEGKEHGFGEERHPDGEK